MPEQSVLPREEDDDNQQRINKRKWRSEKDENHRRDCTGGLQCRH